MPSTKPLPQELKFLEAYVQDRSHGYRHSPYRKEDFEANLWTLTFEPGNSIEIDFSIGLDAAGRLTAPQHRSLLEIFKCWICVQDHFDARQAFESDPMSARHRLDYTLRLIDAVLLDSAHLQLGKHGMGLVTENDWISILSRISSTADSFDGVYGWTSRLTAFLKDRSKDVSAQQIRAATLRHPFLSEVEHDEGDNVLDLDSNQVIAAKIWLWTNDYYTRASSGNRHRMTLNVSKLAAELLPNILGRPALPTPIELRLIPRKRYLREYLPVPTRNDEQGPITKGVFSQYIRALRNVGLLVKIGLPVPTHSVARISLERFDALFDFKAKGRVTSVPPSIILPMLRTSIEFFLRYGDDLVDGYLAICDAAQKQCLTPQSYGTRFDITHHLSPTLIAAGVRVLDLRVHMVAVEHKTNHEEEFFRRFRSSEGLMNMLDVLYGSMLFCIGTTMARRQGELRDLDPDRCLDLSKTMLIFLNEKSGTGGRLDKIARPIPPISVRMVQLMQRLQTEMSRRGLADGMSTLFALPGQRVHGLRVVNASMMHECLDAFSDYFETPLTGAGKRYYFRIHQLRRFFAMMFFWGGAFGGVDTLRWFLGHGDIEHLYHYISESTPGAVLTGAKAAVSAELLRHDPSAAEALADKVDAHFHTRNFCVLDYNELATYIEYLIEAGDVTVEPKFFRVSDQTSYRVIIAVSQTRV